MRIIYFIDDVSEHACSYNVESCIIASNMSEARFLRLNTLQRSQVILL